MERSRLRGKVSLEFLRYLDSKKPKTEEVEVKVKKSKKDDKVKIHGQYSSTLIKRKERRTEVKVINSRRDRKKEQEVRIARQRERGRVGTENKRTRKEKLREALIEKRKAS